MTTTTIHAASTVDEAIRCYAWLLAVWDSEGIDAANAAFDARWPGQLDSIKDRAWTYLIGSK